MIRSAAATWPEMRAAYARRALAILPFGAHEQHGPHCPLETDTVQAAGLAERLAENLDAILLPAIPYGETWNNEGFPGTLSLSFETIQAILYDLAAGLRRGGAQGLIVVNGHFGNHAPLELTMRRVKFELSLPILLIDYPGLERIAAQVCQSQPAAPGFYHADEVETSLMLHLRPETVRLEHAAAEYPQFPADFGATPIPLDTFCQSGVFGDPRSASAEKGKRIMDELVIESMRLIKAFLEELRGE